MVDSYEQGIEAAAERLYEDLPGDNSLDWERAARHAVSAFLSVQPIQAWMCRANSTIAVRDGATSGRCWFTSGPDHMERCGPVWIVEQRRTPGVE